MNVIEKLNSIQNKEMTAKENVEHFIKVIDEKNDSINAFVEKNYEAALKQAEKIDEKIANGEKVGCLSGLVFGIKANINVEDLIVSAASKTLENYKGSYNATVIEKILEEDGIIIGLTNMDEFAAGSSTETSMYGPTENPAAMGRIPGGSSGGSAAAIAAEMCDITLGSDTGGSIRNPASHCGVIGFKPTYGLVSRQGLLDLSMSLDQIGPLTRTVKDNALVLNAISGHDAHDFTSSSREVPDFTKGIEDGVKGMRIAVPKEYFGEGVDEDVAKAVKDAVKTFESLGATVDEVSLPHSKYGVPVYYIIASSEASSNLQRYDGIRYGFRAKDVKNLEDVYVRSRSEGFGDEVKRRIYVRNILSFCWFIRCIL